jgi:hypothetical protein
VEAEVAVVGKVVAEGSVQWVALQYPALVVGNLEALNKFVNPAKTPLSCKTSFVASVVLVAV